MDTVSDAFERLRSEFLREARGAPRLFQDLAKVEQYIAETYKTRAFIELIQNADDAQASKFGIYDFGPGFAAANDGTPFTIGDIESLCRSGSSAKRRGGGTIGYRGIGFKSVVNLAKIVYVFSAEYSFFFDRDMTRGLLPGTSDVPLIRIPHRVAGTGHERATDEAARLMRDFGYRTIFVFQEPNNRLSSEEFLTFDRSCLLFLNNLRFVDLAFGGGQRKISIQTVPDSATLRTVRITEGDVTDEWEILHSRLDPKNMVALKKADDAVVPASADESVFHSFTPTTEFAGAYLKINGDYSTDPSRKTIDVDECSQRSFSEAVSIIADVIISLLNQQFTKKGFFTPFVNANIVAHSPAKLRLLPALAQQLRSRSIGARGDGAIPFGSLRLKPEWLSYEDYENLCHGDMAPVPRSVVLAHPDVMRFLEQMGVLPLLVQDATEKMNESEISALGRAQIASKCIKQYRFDMNDERLRSLRPIKLFQAESGPATASELKLASKVNREFTQHLLDNTDAGDVRFFYKKLGLVLDDPAIERPAVAPLDAGSFLAVANPAGKNSPNMFKNSPAIKQWRSAEKNAEAFLAALNGVLNVIDVSMANLGYDLEVMLEVGRKVYVEVKSVSSFSEPFRLSNNEYSSAHSYGDDYFIALVVNAEPFRLQLIRNPVETLEFQKQCERWSWYCEEYNQRLADPTALVSTT